MKDLLSSTVSSSERQEALQTSNAGTFSDCITTPTDNTALLKVVTSLSDSNDNIEDEAKRLAAKVNIPVTKATTKIYKMSNKEAIIITCACGCGFNVNASFHYCKLCKKKMTGNLII